MTEKSELMKACDDFLSLPSPITLARFDALATPANIKALLTRENALAAENDRLRSALAEKVVSQTTISELTLNPNGINMQFEGGAAHLLADSLAEQFIDSKAENYLEMQFHNDQTGPLILTLQRLKGFTPHQLRVEAEQALAALRVELEEVRAELADTDHPQTCSSSRKGMLGPGSA